MKIEEAMKSYNDLGELFSPEYERDNHILSSFKIVSPQLDGLQTKELIKILSSQTDWVNKIFVADLLYLYKIFDKELIEPLLDCAIYYPDPSFNRIFLKPCVTVFGSKTISNLLKNRFVQANLFERIKISQLVYWIRPKTVEDIAELSDALIKSGNQSENLIELYFYRLIFGDKIKSGLELPKNANELKIMVNGNAELENLLYNQLRWER